MKRISFLFVLHLFLFSSLLAQTDSILHKIVEIGKTDNRTMQHLDVLSNRIGGRLIGSDAFEKAPEEMKRVIVEM